MVKCSQIHIPSIRFHFWLERQFFFSSNFEVFGNWMKRSSECSIKPLKPSINLAEIQRRSSPNFKIINTTFPNLQDGDFICFIFMN